MVRERNDTGADDLAGLMTFASNQQHITPPERTHADPDRLLPVGDFTCTGRGSQNLGTDRGRVFASWVVVGDDDACRQFGGDPSHDRAFALVAIAAAAEQTHETARGKWPQRGECGSEGIWLVGVIDDDQRAPSLPHDPESPLNALKLFE